MSIAIDPRVLAKQIHAFIETDIFEHRRRRIRSTGDGSERGTTLALVRTIRNTNLIGYLQIHLAWLVFHSACWKFLETLVGFDFELVTTGDITTEAVYSLSTVPSTAGTGLLIEVVLEKLQSKGLRHMKTVSEKLCRHSPKCRDEEGKRWEK